MNRPVAAYHQSMCSATVRYRLRLARTFLLAALATAGAFAAHAIWHPSATDEVAASERQLVHWMDAEHDWLLVNDRSAHELAVYDANSGRPLKRLRAAGGMADIEAIARQGDLLLLSAGKGSPVRTLTLPQLQPVELAAR